MKSSKKRPILEPKKKARSSATDRLDQTDVERYRDIAQAAMLYARTNGFKGTESDLIAWLGDRADRTQMEIVPPEETAPGAEDKRMG